jgi:hypothetical protein
MLLLTASRLVAIAILLSGCAASTPPEDADRRHALVAEIAGANVGDVVNLPDVVGNGWSRAVFLGPYANNNDVRLALGFDFDVETASPWTNTEGGTVVVLANDREVVAWMAIPSRDLELECIDQEGIDPADATFTVAEQDGERFLLKQGHPTCRFLTPASS